MAKPADVAKPARKVDNATKTVAAILQEFGRQAFNIVDRSESALQEMCDRWVAHLLLGTASPSREDLRENWFDWPGVRDFVANERGREKSYVVQNIDTYQDLALSLLRDFSESVQIEQESDGQLQERLDNLNDQAKTKSGEELRQEVLSTIAQLNQVLEAKKHRQEEQLHSLSSQVETLKAELSSARESALRDALTKIYNRRAFDAQVEQCLALLADTQQRSVLILADIDHFKALNDTQGHPFGDRVLCEVASSLTRLFNGESDFVARHGGEEFAVIIRGTMDEARLRASEMLEVVRALEIENQGKIHSITISAGLACLKNAESGADWVARADKALYASKDLGRNRITIEGS